MTIALSAKTAACLFGLESAERHGISIEWSWRLIHYGRLSPITTDSRDLAAGGVLFCSIRDLLHDHFSCNKIVNVPQVYNSSAHEIAKLALSWDPDQSWSLE